MDSTFTITFGDQAENHAGMQKIGELAERGFTCAELRGAQQQHAACTIRDLVAEGGVEGYPEACVLVFKGGVDQLLGAGAADDLYQEMMGVETDKKAKMRGRVVNKRARYHVCFDAEPPEPDYEEGTGRIVAFRGVPLVQRLREALPTVFGAQDAAQNAAQDAAQKAADLKAELNHYYDDTCGIGWHGDSERRIVIGVRVGRPIPLHYQWWGPKATGRAPVGATIKLDLDHGDIYVMSEKAAGTDWRRSVVPTLRHAAGARKYLALPK